jgi:hypothetical protein
MGRLADSAREAQKAIEALHGAITRTDRAVQDLDGNELRVALPVVVPDGPGGGGGDGGGGGAPPPSPGLVNLGFPGTTFSSGVYSSSSKGGGKAPDQAEDPWIKSFPDGELSVRLSELQQYGEPTTGLIAGRTVAGWIYAQRFFFPPDGTGVARSSGRGGGGSINPGGALQYVTKTAGGPDGGADYGRDRVRPGYGRASGASTVSAPGVEAGVAAVATEVRALRQAVQGDGGAAFRLGGGLS